MIKVDRKLAEPAVLSKPIRGKTEQQRAIAKFEKLVDGGGDPLNFKFNYRRYSEPRLKDSLSMLFHGKCAYCESRYAGSQPMDVEHWRPKGKIKVEGGELPGYYWLAATWTNLLPSCIDCNRSRRQYDSFLDKEILLGKETQFPVKNDNYLVARDNKPHNLDGDNVGGDEEPLLVNPCVDDPSEFFRYRDGLILPKQGLSGDKRAKAENSITVYALNRSNLVYDRLALERLIAQRVFTLERLLHLADMVTRDDLTLLIDELITHEISCLVEMKGSEKPFSAMATQLVNEHGRRLNLTDRMD